MKRYLLASDFDQTLSFNDSGIILSELLGISDFREKTAGLSRIHLVQQGAELAYLLLHDPEYRRVRKEHLIEVGKRVRLKQNLSLLPRLLGDVDGYGKVALLEELRARLPVSHDRVIYVGDGSSDIHVMLHVNRLNGLTIAVSENKYLAQIAKRTVLSDDAVSVLVPILEDIVGMNATEIHTLFESHGLVLQEWDKVQTDLLTIRETDAAPPLVA